MLLKRLVLPLALLASACTPVDIITSAGTAPAPLEKSTIDEKALKAALAAFDVTLTTIDGLVATGYLVPGSSRALKVQGYVRDAQTAFNAAVAAQKSGSSSNYLTALTQAQAALSSLSTLFRGN